MSQRAAYFHQQLTAIATLVTMLTVVVLDASSGKMVQAQSLDGWSRVSTSVYRSADARVLRMSQEEQSAAAPTKVPAALPAPQATAGAGSGGEIIVDESWEEASPPCRGCGGGIFSRSLLPRLTCSCGCAGGMVRPMFGAPMFGEPSAFGSGWSDMGGGRSSGPGPFQRLHGQTKAAFMNLHHRAHHFTVSLIGKPCKWCTGERFQNEWPSAGVLSYEHSGGSFDVLAPKAVPGASPGASALPSPTPTPAPSRRPVPGPAPGPMPVPGEDPNALPTPRDMPGPADSNLPAGPGPAAFRGQPPRPLPFATSEYGRALKSEGKSPYRTASYNIRPNTLTPVISERIANSESTVGDKKATSDSRAATTSPAMVQTSQPLVGQPSRAAPAAWQLPGAKKNY
ncbi:MAG: hypothetical protein ACKPEY_09835 [Planctomycetota bacterium]